MVLRVDVIDATLRAHYGVRPGRAAQRRRRVIALSPAGGCSTTRSSASSPAEPALTFLCGRYEGFDERIVEHFASDVVSIGRYVLAGGELAAMVCADAVLRKLPGALGHPGLGGGGVLQRGARAACPSTRTTRGPAEFRGWRVPDVLLSGHHEEIRRWRLEQARGAPAAPDGG